MQSQNNNNEQIVLLNMNCIEYVQYYCLKAFVRYGVWSISFPLKILYYFLNSDDLHHGLTTALNSNNFCHIKTNLTDIYK